MMANELAARLGLEDVREWYEHYERWRHAFEDARTVEERNAAQKHLARWEGAFCRECVSLYFRIERALVDIECEERGGAR